MELQKRKYPRFKNKDLYSTQGMIAHITIGTDQKAPIFKENEYAEAICQIIINTAKEKGNRLYAYCVMHDHIHILVESAVGCSIIEYVKFIKGRFSTICRKNGWKVKLQRSFYDHFLRIDEDIEKVTRYIIENPIRTGISKSIHEYSFAGSMVFDL